MAPDIAALKLKHAEHILEVVRGAEKQEAVRQRKLRHATSKTNLAYLQKRFDAERRKDQTHIAGLVHDANAVEAALRRGPQKDHHRQRDRPYEPRGDSDSCGGGGGASVGASVGTTASNKSNAYVESEPKEDPNFISLDQMRFMKYVYAHVDDQKAARAHARLMTQLVGAEKSADKLQDRRQSRIRSNGGEVTLAALGKADAGTLESSGRGREQSVRGVISSQPHGGGVGNVGNRRRLLEQKREILLEMKGVVCRQAEALDRLVEGNANVNRAPQARGRGDSNGSRRRRSFQGSHGGASTKSSSVPYEGAETVASSSKARKTAGCQSTRRASCPDASDLVVRNTPATLSSSTAGVKALPPPRPPENDTSAFLARGGRWGGGSRQGTSRRGSVASASWASYATYCSPSGERATLQGSRRPAAVPALPLV